MLTSTLLTRSQQLSDDFSRCIHDRSIRAGVRERLAAGSFDAVHEHHRAICLLIREQLFGSAFALVRPMFDGCICGMWLAHLADDVEIDEFVKNRKSLEPAKVIKRLNKNNVHSNDILDRIYRSSWGSMSAYVHGGYLQVLRRNSPDFIGSNYDEKEISEVLIIANWFALLAGLEVTEFSDDQTFSEDAKAIARAYVGEVDPASF